MFLSLVEFFRVNNETILGEVLKVHFKQNKQITGNTHSLNVSNNKGRITNLTLSFIYGIMDIEITHKEVHLMQVIITKL